MSPEDVLDGKYAIVRKLGQGGMGAVYEGRHGGTGRRVAIKVISSERLRGEAEGIARFRREARAAGAVESQHVVQVLDSGVDPRSGDPYIVSELLDGEDVAKAIERLGALPADVVLRIGAQACVGLTRVHAAGIVHRDVKSANVFLARRDEGEIVVKLLDFGIAKVSADTFAKDEPISLTRSGSMMGSPLYMSPEQARGGKLLDHRTDIWSLGIVLYEALTGATPYSGCDTVGEFIFAVYSEDPRPIRDAAPWVPKDAAAIVHRALARDPGKRFGTAAEMLAAIRAVLPSGQSLHESHVVGRATNDAALAATQPMSGTGDGVEKPPPPNAKTRPAWALAGAGAVALALGVVGVRAWSHRVADVSAPAGSPAAAIVTVPATPAVSTTTTVAEVPAITPTDAGAVAPQAAVSSNAPPAARPAVAPPAPSARPARPATSSSASKPSPGVYDQMY